MRDTCAPDFAAQGVLSIVMGSSESEGCTLQARENSRGEGEEMAIGKCLSREGKIKEEE